MSNYTKQIIDSGEIVGGKGGTFPPDNFVRDKDIIFPPPPDNPTVQCTNI